MDSLSGWKAITKLASSEVNLRIIIHVRKDGLEKSIIMNLHNDLHYLYQKTQCSVFPTEVVHKIFP